MERQKINQFLKKLNLDDREIKVYLYCLNHGPQLISRLSQLLNVSRTNGYDIITKLEKKGLCYAVGSHYGKKIAAHPAATLKNLLAQKTNEIDTLKTELDSLLPMFASNTNDINSVFSRVSYFEGKENVMNMIWQSLQCNNKIIKIAGSEIDIAETLGKNYLIDFHTNRTHKGITLQAMRPDQKRLPGIVFENDKKYLREIRIRPKDVVKLKSNMIIWDNTIAFYTLKDKTIFGTLIESPALSMMLSSWFDFIWSHSKKI